jgi:hypothetical protein
VDHDDAPRARRKQLTRLLREGSERLEKAGCLAYSELLLRACIEIQGIDHRARAEAAQALAPSFSDEGLT